MDRGGELRRRRAGLSGVRRRRGGCGEGIGLGSIGTIGHGAGTGSLGSASASSQLSVGNLAAVAQAEGVEAGALFRYSLKQAVDLRAHGSALVPFLSDGIAARRIALFSAPGDSARSAVHLTHQGKQTLPPGTLAVFADGGFAGEASLQRMKPKETQVVEFGVDLDVELREVAHRQTDEVKLLGYASGKLVQHYVRHHALRYELENRSGSGRDVFLKLRFVNNAKVEGADELAYDTNASTALAVFKLAARKKIERPLSADEGLSRRIDPKTLGSRALSAMANSKVLPERQKKLVRAAADKLLEAEVRRGARGKRRAELGEIEADISRLREHARAIGAVRGAEEVVKRLLASEDKAKGLRKRIAELGVEDEQKRREAMAILARLGG